MCSRPAEAAPPTSGRRAAPPRSCARTPGRRPGWIAQRRAGDRHQVVDRQAVRDGPAGWRAGAAGRRGRAGSRPCRRCRRSRWSCPRRAPLGQGVQPVLVGPGGDHLVVVLRPGVEVVVVVVEPRGLQAPWPGPASACPGWRRSPGPAPSRRRSSPRAWAGRGPSARARPRPCRTAGRPPALAGRPGRSPLVGVHQLGGRHAGVEVLPTGCSSRSSRRSRRS